MRVPKIQGNPISFKLKTVLKTEWLNGNMPTVIHDIGGNILTPENVTNGHMLARSKGGTNELKNITLETMAYNNMKGNKPFSWFFDAKNFMQYCEEMKQVKLPNFDGWEYVKSIITTAFELVKDKK